MIIVKILITITQKKLLMLLLEDLLKGGVWELVASSGIIADLQLPRLRRH